MRVMLAEDSVLLREGLVRLLAEEGHTVAAAVGDAEELLAAVAGGPPDVAVVDVRMPPTHTDEGMRAALHLRAAYPGTGVLVLSQYVERRYAVELLTGAPAGVGYILKDRVADVDGFLDALDRVGAGGAVFDPEVVSRLLVHTRRTDPLSRLSDRESAVLRLMAQGRTNTAIAGDLALSVSAVEKYVHALFARLALPPTPDYSRRVLAILKYLDS
ncbi:response regulator transcription factor [Nocardiopsis coralliicola]